MFSECGMLWVMVTVCLSIYCCYLKGSRSPEPRTHAMGVYPIYKIRSAIVSQEEVSIIVLPSFMSALQCI